ncbi:MAG: alpha/beta fold hydrolase [Ktedonobacteraceae bacterium]
MNTDKNQHKGYATVNGLNIYYEIHGSGEPLVLLPGGFMTVEAMGGIVQQLASTRQVIGVELQGHGHTADIERPLSFELMADDIAALISHLGLDRVDLFGYSLGVPSDCKPPSAIQRRYISWHSPRLPLSAMVGIPSRSQEWPR